MIKHLWYQEFLRKECMFLGEKYNSVERDITSGA